MSVQLLDVQGTPNASGSYPFVTASYPGGATLFVNSATGIDIRRRVKFANPTSQSGQRPAGTIGPTGDPALPLASVFGPGGAISFCSANAGDTIIVAPGHTETLTGTGAINIPAGVTIIGSGYGASRPTFLWNATGQVLTPQGAVQLQNLIFDLTGIAAVVTGFSVGFGGVQFILCRFRQTSGANQAAAAVTIIAGGDDCQFINTEFDANESAGAANGIVAGAGNPSFKRALISSGSYFHGNWSAAAVNLNSTAAVEYLIENSIIRNYSTTGVDLLLASGNATTGAVVYSNLYTSATTTAGFLTNGAGTGMSYTQVFGSDQAAGMTGNKNSALFPAAGTN